MTTRCPKCNSINSDNGTSFIRCRDCGHEIIIMSKEDFENKSYIYKLGKDFEIFKGN